MSTEVHHFNVGAFECMAVSDGTLTYAPPTFPPPATLPSKEILEKSISYPPFLIQKQCQECRPDPFVFIPNDIL